MPPPFDPTSDTASVALPEVLPVFPLAGALLLPGGHLPLHIFEPRYRNMTRDALAGDRLIGMIQPAEATPDGSEPTLFRTGCAGRIASDEMTEDGRYKIVLEGLCRFHIDEELPPVDGYRRVRADYAAYGRDLGGDGETAFDRARLLPLLESYLEGMEVAADWDAIADTTDARLIDALAVLCPFEPREKQALLESPTPAARGEMVLALIEMAVLARRAGGAAGPGRSQ